MTIWYFFLVFEVQFYDICFCFDTETLGNILLYTLEQKVSINHYLEQTFTSVIKLK